jgi:acetoin utilization deacetylase AcuC-like enzyme
MKLAGDMYEIGAGKGKYFSLNVPLKDGIDDEGGRSRMGTLSSRVFRASLFSGTTLFSYTTHARLFLTPRLYVPLSTGHQQSD